MGFRKLFSSEFHTFSKSKPCSNTNIIASEIKAVGYIKSRPPVKKYREGKIKGILSAEIPGNDEVKITSKPEFRTNTGIEL